jgi:hypothetical protein
MKIPFLLPFQLLVCALPAASIAQTKPEGSDQTPSAQTLVRNLDAIRLPSTSFTVEVKSTERPINEPARDIEFRLYAKTTSRTPSSRTFASLIAMKMPESDRNKLILMRDAKVWFYDPRSQNATILSAKQLWQHSFAADSLTVRIEEKYDARIAGSEMIETLDNGKKNCITVDLNPRGKRITASETVRYWLSREGRPYQSVYFAASGKPLRTCRFGGYSEVLGAQRATRIAVDDIKGVSSFHFSGFRATELPDSIFDPDNLPRLRINADAHP